jgi:hypothetical protein
MCNHAGRGGIGSSRGFTIIEKKSVGEDDTLPKNEESAVTEDNA